MTRRTSPCQVHHPLPLSSLLAPFVHIRRARHRATDAAATSPRADDNLTETTT